MALADSVPGVSGGTIAFIMGFYEKFISSLSALFHGGRRERLAAAGYLAVLGCGWTVGMALAATLLARVFTTGIYQLSSMFLGFVLASIPVMLYGERKAVSAGGKNMLCAVPGAALVVCLSMMKLSLPAGGTGLSAWAALYVFAAGVLAISAMVLPGISGSSLLMSCGLYVPVISALRDTLSLNFDMLWLLAALSLGILAGAVLSPRLLKRLLDRNPGAAIFTILGMMAGSVYAIVIGPSTLRTPQHIMGAADFSVLWFIIGIAAVLGLSGLKAYVVRGKNICAQT